MFLLTSEDAVGIERGVEVDQVHDPGHLLRQPRRNKKALSTRPEEDQPDALGPVTNTVVLWNTVYMEAALSHLRVQGIKVQPADLARLSPVRHTHNHVLGRYASTLPEPIANGALRPLHKGFHDQRNFALQ